VLQDRTVHMFSKVDTDFGMKLAEGLKKYVNVPWPDQYSAVLADSMLILILVGSSMRDLKQFISDVTFRNNFHLVLFNIDDH
jgi:hypothetical protein